jgi:16S rRNA (cytidine1402-2'-O)-methyltransferase
MKTPRKTPQTLYIVSTPIGNLGDITMRALETLKNADAIACEDTRVTAKLLSHYGIKKSLIVYNDHSAPDIRHKIVKRVYEGENIALVSDAGTPLISDPGYKLVVEAKNMGVKVVPIPGVSSPITALSAAGLPTDRFFFAGFIPDKKSDFEKILQDIKGIKSTSIFFIRGSKIAKRLEEIETILGDVNIVIARELTKKFEEFIEGNVTYLKQYLHEKEILGEVVLLISPVELEEKSQEDLPEFIKNNKTKYSTRELSEIISNIYGIKKKEAYQLILQG